MEKISNNPYEYLRSVFRGDDRSWISIPSRLRISDEDEIIDILTSKTTSGQYAVGHVVYWPDGRQSNREPDPYYGVFDSEREARLWAVGYMLSYARHFGNGIVMKLRNMEKELAQQVLF